VAATATYAVALLERRFEVFEAAIGEVGRNLSHDEKIERRERAPEARA
jgi:hypothetical protein